MASTEGLKRTPRSARLPQSDVDSAVRIANAVHELAGPSSRARVAQQLGVSPTGSGFKTDVASAKYMGLVVESKQKLSLAKRGEDAVSRDSGTAERARQDALLASNFGQLIIRLSGRSADEGTVSARLQEDYGVPEESADRLAATLVSSARSVGIIVNDRWDAEAVEAAAGRVTPGSPDEPDSKPSAKTPGSSREPERGDATRPRDDQVTSRSSGEKEKQKRPFERATQAMNVNVNVSVDLAAVSTEKVIELLKALREFDSETPSN